MNTYLTSYFPIFSITLFSISFATKLQSTVISLFKSIGMYNSLLEFFSEAGIRLAFIIFFSVLLFMVMSALKLIADTINELSLLFFSKDYNGETISKARSGSLIFFAGSILSLFGLYSYYLWGGILILTSLFYFVYFVHSASGKLSISGIIFVIIFQVLTWTVMLTGFVYLCIKIYNSLIASLPI